MELQIYRTLSNNIESTQHCLIYEWFFMPANIIHIYIYCFDVKKWTSTVQCFSIQIHRNSLNVYSMYKYIREDYVIGLIDIIFSFMRKQMISLPIFLYIVFYCSVQER